MSELLDKKSTMLKIHRGEISEPRYIAATSSSPFLFFPKILMAQTQYALFPAQRVLRPNMQRRSNASPQPSTTSMFKYTFLVSCTVGVGLQELEFLKGKGKSRGMEPVMKESKNIVEISAIFWISEVVEMKSATDYRLGDFFLGKKSKFSSKNLM